MKKILLVILIISPLLILSQNNEHTIQWHSNLLFESNNLDKNFLNTVFFGGYIDQKMKDIWINNESTNNILFTELSNGLTYNYSLKNQDFNISFFDRNIIKTNFSNDLLRLLLEGNYNYQDATLNFDNTSIRADRFQQYKLGYGVKITDNIKFNSAVSYLIGNHHLSYIIDKGEIYTSPFGSYLDIEYNMNAFVTDTSSIRQAFINNGNGIALDLMTMFKIKEYNIQVSIEDLGFIMWKQTSMSLAVDSTLRFQGIEIDDIFNFNDSILEINNIYNDSINKQNTSFKSYIPAKLNLGISGRINNDEFKTYTMGVILKWQPYQDNMALSFKKIIQGIEESNYDPLFYIKSKTYIKETTLFPSISYGGYTKNLNIGLAIEKGKKNKFTIGSQHLEELLNWYSAKALSVYLNIKIQL